MKARANTESKFLYKYLLIGIGTLLFSLYCYYDAFINYPGQRPASTAYDELLENIETRKAEAADDDPTNWAQVRESEWKEIASSKGWAEKPPHYTAEELQHNIDFSIGLGALCTLIAVPCIIWFFRTKGTWLEIDGTTLRASNGQSLDFSQIKTLDKKKWVKKGLADINYQGADGKDSKFVLDDLKYDRSIVDEMIATVELAIGDEKVVNGPTEIEIAKEREAARAARQQKLAELEVAEDDSEETES